MIAPTLIACAAVIGLTGYCTRALHLTIADLNAARRELAAIRPMVVTCDIIGTSPVRDELGRFCKREG